MDTISTHAEVVYCGIGGLDQNVAVPKRMGTPRHDQMRGTPLERLSELAGRICYDSLGKGRPSFRVEDGPDSAAEGYHDHIRSVKHYSTIEHCWLTLRFNTTRPIPLEVFPNRPQLVFLLGDSHMCQYRVSVNLRHIVEWDNVELGSDSAEQAASAIGFAMRCAAHMLAPHIVRLPGHHPRPAPWLDKFEVVVPVDPREIFISVFLAGSRGFSHEQVRHRFEMSQRSTRYVDESQSPWVVHPLLSSILASDQSSAAQDVQACMAAAQAKAKAAYDTIVEYLQPKMEARGVSKTDARKQARGAARGFLGNALYTEMIFTASIAQWNHIMKMRACAAADAEIREIAVAALRSLKACEFRQHFVAWKIIPAPDGIGEIAILEEAE